MLSSSTGNYALGGALVLLAAFSFTFLDGPTAVYVGIAAAVAAAVLIIRGVQLSGDEKAGPTGFEGFGQPNDRGTQDFDWDEHYKREFGSGGGPENSNWSR